MQPFASECGQRLKPGQTSVRKISALILSMAFLAAQYARQISFLECSVSNYFKAGTETCDCEKILVSETSDDQPGPINHNHAHIDESYCLSGGAILLSHPSTAKSKDSGYPQFGLHDGIYGQPDHPPDNSKLYTNP